MYECVINAGVSIANEIMWVYPFMVLSRVLATLNGYLSDLCMSGCYHTYGSDFSVSKDVVYSGCNKLILSLQQLNLPQSGK